MRIYSITRLLYLPLLLIIGWYIYLMFGSDYDDHSKVIIPVILITILYVSQAHIDNWWLKKFPPTLDDKMQSWLNQYLPYYKAYPSALKAEFDKRLIIYVESREFKSVGSNETRDVPYDLKNIIASQGIRLCLGLDDYLIKDMDRIYLYKHPFPSPAHQYLHNEEVNVEDGVYIFSTEYGMPGIVNPGQFYNIVLHGYAESFVLLFHNIHFPDVHHDGWDGLENVLGLKKQDILHHLGHQSIDLLPVHIVAFFEKNQQYATVFPDYAKQFTRIFNHHPV